MRNFSRVAITVAISLLTLLSVSLAPAQADELSPSPAPDPAATDASTPGDESAPAAPSDGESAQPAPAEETQSAPDASASEPSAPQDSPTASSSEPSASVSRAPAATALAETYATEILKPVDGASVPEGSVAYTVQVATPGNYWLDLYCGGDFLDDVYLTASSDGQQFTGNLGTVYEGDGCQLELYADSGNATGSDQLSFTVAIDLMVRNAVAKPDVFYPTVRDGFRDSTAIGFGTRLDSDVTVKIVSRSTGSVVRTFNRPGRSWRDYAARRWVRWNGKNRAGNVVPTGRYRAVITSRLGGQTAAARVPITVASGHRTVRVTKNKDGWYGSRDQTRGNCYTWEVPDGNDLDCWGGAYAQATYRFALPRNARNIDWGVRGYRECCSPGRIIKTGKKTSATSFRIQVRVTNWRSYVVRRTWVRYTYRKAI